MNMRVVLASTCAALVAAVAWFSVSEQKPETLKVWEKVLDGIYRSKESPHSYALVSGDKALLIDASVPPEALAELQVKTIETVLITHHHRDTVEFASEYRKKGVAVRAPKE